MKKQSNQRSFRIFVILALTFSFIISGCSNNDSGAKTSTSEDKITIKIGHIMTPTNPVELGLQEFKKIVEKETSGKVTVETYHSSVLGGEMEMFQQVTTGQLDSMVTSSISIIQGINPLASVEEIPFMFKDAESAHKAYDGDFGDKLISEVIEPNGVKVINFWENGFRHFTNNKREIYEPNDMAGIKFRSAEVPLRIKMFKVLGANAIPMAFPEVFTGLQQGTIDGQENPLSTIDSSKFYEVQDYLSLSGHIYNSGALMFNQKVWDSYSDDVKEIIIKAAKVARDYERGLIKDNESEIIKRIEESGTVVNRINKDAFIEAVQPVWDDFITEYGDEFINLAIKYNE